MDPSQASQLLTWLDEEHRKDKALLMALQSQVDAQKAQLKDQARQLQETEAVLARIEGRLPRLAQIEDSVQTVRTEFAGLLAKHTVEHEVQEEKRSQAEQTETETLARIIHQVQERVEALGTFEKTAALLSKEDDKLRSEMTKALERLSDNARRLDAQQSRLDLLEQDTPVFRDGLTESKLARETLSNQVLALKAGLDNVAPPLEAKLGQLQAAFEEANRRRLAETGAAQAKQQDQARLLEELSKEVVALQTPIERWTKQMKEFTEQFERNRKTLYDLRELEKQVRQQGNEMIELQRLTADRTRTDVREWQDAQVKVDDQQNAHLERLEAWQRKTSETLSNIEGRLEENKQEIAACADRLWQTWTEYMQGQTAFLESVVKQRGKS